MNLQTAGLALLVVAAGWLRSEAAESTALLRCQRAGEILATIQPEMAVERAVFEEELDRAVALGTCSIAEKEMALAKVRLAYGDDDQPGSQPPAVLRLRQSEAQHALRQGEPASASAQLLRWLGNRIGIVQNIRGDARTALQEAALDYAEQTWLTAEKPADLEPAIRQLTETKAAQADYWHLISSFRSNYRFTKPPTFPPFYKSLYRELANVYDFLSVLTSPEPFFLPDPALDPAGFADGRSLWPTLVEVGHAFTLRPAILARYLDCQERLLALQQAQRTALDALILREASAAEFEPPYQRYLLSIQPAKPRPLRPPFPTAALISDYRDIAALGNFTGSFATRETERQVLSHYPDLEAYGDWLSLLHAEQTGNASHLRSAREKLLKTRSYLPPSLSAHLGPRLDGRAKPASNAPSETATPAAPPVDTLLAYLRGLVAADEDRGQDDAKALIAAWEKVRDGTSATDSSDADRAQNFWLAVSSRPGSRALFALRDRAARQLLARLYPAENTLATATTPLATELRERLAAALTAGPADLTGSLLALDAAGNFLPPTEHLAWARDAAMLRNAATLLAADQRAAARTAYLQAIQQLSEPALGEFAARQALRLRSTPPAKVP